MDTNTKKLSNASLILTVILIIVLMFTLYFDEQSPYIVIILVASISTIVSIIYWIKSKNETSIRPIIIAVINILIFFLILSIITAVYTYEPNPVKSCIEAGGVCKTNCSTADTISGKNIGCGTNKYTCCKIFSSQAK